MKKQLNDLGQKAFQVFIAIICLVCINKQALPSSLKTPFGVKKIKGGTQLSDLFKLQLKSEFKTLNNRGVLLSNQKDLRRAIAFYKKSIALNPASPFVQYNLANVYLLSQDYPSAIRVLESLLGDYRIDQHIVNYNLGFAHMQLEQPLIATKLFIKSDCAEGYFNLSFYLIQLMSF